MSRARELRAVAVVDLGFGDAGKGLVTDWLTRRLGADVIVRFNGGAQAGHNVVTEDGRHHTFAQIGAGSFVDGVRTFLSRHMVIHPGALVLEARALQSKGVSNVLSRVAVSENALVVSPYHQAANRLRELARGADRHGTCGVGVGEAVQASLSYPEEAVRAGDLRDRRVLEEKLLRLRRWLQGELRTGAGPRSPEADHERAIFDSDRVIAPWCAQVEPVAACVVPDHVLGAWLAASRAVIFEGAQGVLLDGTLGFHPHTSWSRCTTADARELLAEAAPRARMTTFGVMRAHAVRHGAGPLPTEERVLDGLVTEHNAENAWQGRVRRGWFDLVLARYALALVPDVDTLVMTHVDALARRSDWRTCDAYHGDLAARPALVSSRRPGRITDIVPLAEPSLERQERIGRLLEASRPELEPAPAEESAHLAHLEARLGRRIDVVARGPRAADVDAHTSAASCSAAASAPS